MSHGLLHYNSLHKKKPNADLQSNVDTMLKKGAASVANNTAAATVKNEAKAIVVTIPIIEENTAGTELIRYEMLIGEKMPSFTFWPRGREIFYRLVMRAQEVDSLDEL